MKRLLCLLAAYVLASAVLMNAASAQDTARAEELNTEGKKLVKQLELDEAADRFRQAMKLVDDPRYAFNLCYTLEKIREFDEARRACKRVEAADDPRLASKATQLLVGIEKELAEQRAAGETPAPPPTKEPAPPADSPPPGPADGPAPAPASRPPAVPGTAQPGQWGRPSQPGGPNVQQWSSMPQERTRNYGIHVLIADAASWTVLLLSIGAESEGLTALGFGGLLFGGSAVHLVHGNSRGALLSVGSRLVMPLGGALLFSSGCDDFDCIGGVVAGGLLGYGGALAFDWLVFAEKTEFVNPGMQAVVRPTLGLTRGGAVAGLRLQL